MGMGHRLNIYEHKSTYSTVCKDRLGADIVDTGPVANLPPVSTIPAPSLSLHRKNFRKNLKRS